MGSAAAVLPLSMLIASSASAHIELLDPVSRYTSNGNKSCPCGEGDSNRVCNVTAAESSDPNRSTDSAKITEYEVGSTITVFFDEYIGHSGRFRVAFDGDGADLTDFNSNILVDIPDPSDGRGMREIEVTLPDTPCDNCTLQLIQAMHGDTENPVADPVELSTYYTCADIKLVPVGSLGQSSGETMGSGEPDAGVMQDDITPPASDSTSDSSLDDGGCSASAAVPSSRWSALGLLGLLLAFGGLRRRRSAS